MDTAQHATIVRPGSFEQERHYYPKVLNAQVHPLVSYFFNLSKERIINRYCHLHPLVQRERLKELIEYQPKYFAWAGADLFHVTTKAGERKMVLIETNSCPSGQKSMPLLQEHQESGGYQTLIEQSFLPRLAKKRLPPGKLAVVYDKNFMENSAYAAALADTTGEPVFLAPFFVGDPDPPVRFVEGVMQVRDEQGLWHPIRAALRYVTQKPWNRIPLQTKTYIFNSTLTCISGGRNKMIAAKAYDMLNSELTGSGLVINVPETMRDISKAEIPLWVQRFNGQAVIKIPYSNAGQGVFTITNEGELQDFMSKDYAYDQFIVQSLIGNYAWSSQSKKGTFYHVGTLPNKKGEIFAADLRMMLISTKNGFRPVALYARKAKKPLADKLSGTETSWDMLGTNLSVKEGQDQWSSDTSRLMIMDRKDFNSLGIGVDDLIEAYVQTLLAIISIDNMAQNLINQKGKFRMRLFRSLNTDESLLSELLVNGDG